MNHRLAVALAGALSLAITGCSTSEPPAKADAAATSEASNPLFVASTLPFGYPPFDTIRDEHYTPAFEKGMAENAAEIEVIANNAEPASFENTIVAMERSGELLDRVQTIFFSLAGANTNDTLEKIQSEMAPKLSAHRDAIALNSKLFARVKSLYEQRDSLGLDAESKYLLERYHTDFVRAGANLSDADKEKLKAINSELASLQTSFSQNVLKETNASAIVVDSRDELSGLSDNAIAAAAQAAKAAGKDGKFMLAMMNTSGQPSLASLENRALRERIQTTSVGRGSHGGEYDNRANIARVAKLRAERALLMGYANHAAYSLEDQTARTTQAVNKMLSDLAPAAVANARKEAADMQKLIDAKKGGFQLAAWDWAYYAEKVRSARYDFDESQLRPYFEIDNVLQNGVFFAANQLYGLSFKERTDLPVYQPDVRVFDVFDADGSQLAIFIADFYARPSKRGGAWMNAYVSQSSLLGTQPVVANHLNIPKPPQGEPTLLTFDEANTMFHEFGHALHGMFSNVRYPRFSGTSVPRDFVEYPSQVNEMWMTWPEVLANYAKHYQTGEPMPQALLDKVMATQKFNQGFATTEYLAASLLDQAWHQVTPEQVPDADGVLAFEANALKQAGVDFAPVPPRYRSTYFSHIIGGYAAGYYSYIWSEVLDADSVEWFKENGGLKRENGDHFRKTLLSRGGAEDAMTLFANFRGRAPDTNPLLARRGLDGGDK
ncbi:MAG: M3 family metallopeptidase [Xanthomonadaceae bacterium]|nr:M3 family metallopeptidase [Xanthomonadaceae bacterium]MDP2185082.1 M3 family metallopeptidase [Xanthomonadales bacterium]MDZ4116593.1 M3 family metallopeptidase [Xanthomonadaceae bacterium]MDZ4379101.1 M3 family metallopeptidase [Xanthomonadaceae bacterium]